MTDTVRCPSCRGSKKVPKLGGVIGDCNTCAGKGTILAVDKPKPVIAEPIESVADIIKAVDQALPDVVEDDVKIDPKRAIFRRKKGE